MGKEVIEAFQMKNAIAIVVRFIVLKQSTNGFYPITTIIHHYILVVYNGMC